MLSSGDYVVWNNKATLEDKKELGSEIASLGELSHHHIPIHHRLLITPYAFNHFLVVNNLSLQIKHLLGTIDHDRHESLSQVAGYIKGIITHSKLPDEIISPLFKEYGKLEEKFVSLRALYFKDGEYIGEEIWQEISGEAVLAESVRFAWAHLFSAGYIKTHTIHHHNHHSLNVLLVVIPDKNFSLSGEIHTHGKNKDEYEIEAHNLVKFTYNKRQKAITHGHYHKEKVVLNAREIHTLLQYGINAERALYLPHILYWNKYKNDFLVTKVIPSTFVDKPSNTYSALVQNVSVHPGVVIGRLKIVNETNKTALAVSEEIIYLKKLDKNMIETVKKAKGIIVEEIPHPEIAHVLKQIGIPTVVKNRHSMLYSTGDVISLNAATGEIKRGSMLVS